MKKVLIFTSLPQRDRVPDEILSEHLRKMGYDVRVTPFLPLNRMHILGMKPDIVILPEIRCHYTIGLANMMRTWGIRVVCKRCEGGCGRAAWSVMCDDEKATALGSWPYEVDLELVWGDEFRDILIEKGYGTSDVIKSCGAFPFDVYLYSEIKGKKEGGRPTVMFATGWPMADRNSKYCVPEAEPSSSIHKIAYDKHREGRDKWLEVMPKVIDALKDEWDFILRMKTGEKPHEYSEVLGPKLKFTPPEPVILGLKRCDIVIHAGSTMAQEAHLMDMPAINLMGELVETPGYTPAQISPYCMTADELIELIKNATLGKSNANLEAIEQSKKDFYGPIDGLACKRAALEIDKLPVATPQIPDVWPPNRKEFPFPGAFATVESWHCDCCDKMTHTTNMSQDMIRCVWCGISLVRNDEQAEIIRKTQVDSHKERTKDEADKPDVPDSD